MRTGRGEVGASVYARLGRIRGGRSDLPGSSSLSESSESFDGGECKAVVTGELKSEGGNMNGIVQASRGSAGGRGRSSSMI